MFILFYAKGLHYSGDLREWHGPSVFPDGCVVTGDPYTCPNWCYGDDGCGCYGRGPRSIKCRCDQEPIECVPEDGWETVIQCDNINGLTDFHCAYTKVKDQIQKVLDNVYNMVKMCVFVQPI